LDGRRRDVDVDGSPNGIVTLTSDLGTVDGYVAAMKGALLGVNPRATLVDVTHHIPTRDVTEAAFQIATVWTSFPPGTIHVIVVDSGLDVEYRRVAVAAGGQYFIVPDNGLLTLLVGNVEPSRVVVLDRTDLYRSDASPTFPGRDIFAPVAGHLSSGTVSLTDLGTPVDTDSLAKLPWEANQDNPARVHAPVVSIDRFGNCRTLITRSQIPGSLGSVFVRCGDVTLRGIYRTYTDVPVGKTLALFGSHGGLEIAVRGGSAAQSWEIRRGQDVTVMLADDSPSST
jgi:S-adenosylmethionine hydrolase